MTNHITMYSTPTCAPCKIVEKRLTAEGIPYTKVDLTEDAEALESLKRTLGVEKVNTPVIRYAGEHHQINGLTGIIARYKEAA